MWADGNPSVDLGGDIVKVDLHSWHTVGGLKLLCEFCQTGAQFCEGSHDTNLLVKELLYYCVLDVFLQVWKKGSENDTIERSGNPWLPYLVHSLSFCIQR
jgi:hypothetical protein